MGEFLDFPTLVVIVVAIVILLRLRSVLGTRTGNERPPSPGYERVTRPRNDNGDDKVIPLPNRRNDVPDADAERAQRKLEAEIEKFGKGNPEIEAGLRDIAAADPSFTPKLHRGRQVRLRNDRHRICHRRPQDAQDAARQGRL
jgi:predicted lipid-binding transport protein (Tim44 family)